MYLRFSKIDFSIVYLSYLELFIGFSFRTASEVPRTENGSQEPFSGKSTQLSESTSTVGSGSQAPSSQPNTGSEVAESEVPQSESELFFETGFEDLVANIMDLGYDRPQVNYF